MSTWFISPTGSNTTGDGSISNPYATIGKCISVCTDGDTIKLLNGTYLATNSTDITKQVKITSNSGAAADVIIEFSSECLILKNNNIKISHITFKLKTGEWNAISINNMMVYPYNVIPVFFNNIIIHDCIFYTGGKGIFLNGNFNIFSNVFIIYTPTVSGGSTDIFINSMRGNCTISNNTFSCNNDIFKAYCIWMGGFGVIGQYADWASSKGGSLNINNNIVNYNSIAEVYNSNKAIMEQSKFIHIDMFNKHLYGAHGPDETYNDNTRLTMSVYNNVINVSTFQDIMIMNIETKSNSDYNTFDLSRIYNNTNNNTINGALNLDKTFSIFGSKLTINQVDLDRPVFRVFNNTINSILLITNNWSTLSRYSSYILDINDQPVVTGGTVSKWISCRYYTVTDNFINGGSNLSVLEQETRNSNPYKYIKTINATNGYMISNTGVFKSGYTIFIAFRESSTGYFPATGSMFMKNGTGNVYCLHNSSGVGVINGDATTDTSLTRYTPRIWAIRFNVGSPCTYVVPLNGNPAVPNIIEGTTTITINDLDTLKFGQVDDNYPSSICIYEIKIILGTPSNDILLQLYDSLKLTWGITA